MIVAETFANGPSLLGWWIGLGVGFALVAALVAVVAAVLATASRVASQAQRAADVLEAAQRSTRSLWVLQPLTDAAHLVRDAVRDGARIPGRPS